MSPLTMSTHIRQSSNVSGFDLDLAYTALASEVMDLLNAEVTTRRDVYITRPKTEPITAE